MDADLIVLLRGGGTGGDGRALRGGRRISGRAERREAGERKGASRAFALTRDSE